MPAMKDARICGAYDFYFGSHIFAIEHHILAAPANDFLIEAAYLEEVRAILARHAIAKVAPEARVPRDEQLLFLAGQRLALQCVHHVRIVQAKHDGIINLKGQLISRVLVLHAPCSYLLAWRGIPATALQKFGCEYNVHIAHEEQRILRHFFRLWLNVLGAQTQRLGCKEKYLKVSGGNSIWHPPRLNVSFRATSCARSAPAAISCASLRPGSPK